MRIEATSWGIRYRWPGGEIAPIPGQLVELERMRAVKVTPRYPDLVRRVDCVQAGQIIEFHSPLFGICTSRLLLVEDNTAIVEAHSVLQNTVAIPSNWVWQKGSFSKSVGPLFF